jgi:hypothetical protein
VSDGDAGGRRRTSAAGNGQSADANSGAASDANSGAASDANSGAATDANNGAATDANNGAAADHEDLAAEVELLAEENRRLRAEYRRARQARHRRTALGMAALGLVALGGAALFPPAREVLLALSGTGLFAAVLLYTLTPERFVPADVGERVVDAHAATGAALVADLGLADARVYLPGGADARLFVPQREGVEPPAPDDLDGPFVVDEAHRGVALPPTGAGLFDAFRRDLTRDAAADPATLAGQLTDALVEGFELAGTADADLEPGRFTVAVSDAAHGDVAAFDHPVASFLGVGIASALDVPATVEVSPGDDRADALVTVRWPADDQAATRTAGEA